ESLLGFIDQALATPPDHFKEITGELNAGEDGEIVLGASCAPFRDRSGLNIGAITVLRDITALKKMDRMKSDFVSMVSHEIRGPMNSLQMQIKVILDGLAGEVTEKQRQILERASGKIDNLVNMASELLDLSRIESGLINREKEEMDMSDLLVEQADFHQPRAREGGVRIHLEPLPPLPLILANRGNMEEILSNLITNAVKYSPLGGRVTISAGEEDGYLVIRVKDEGLGIPAEDLERIFTRFYRVKNAETRYIHGTGLGLAIVKSIVEAHNGDIRVESRLNRGTLFSVHLPNTIK
ncbi:MAG: cell wall metabolism sensor histidine kinase WalK, partial [Desulfobacterales bacterium]|nr:cell wall metabolism sensor histidine kinase WalK [Desulfobacterales bacterium]